VTINDALETQVRGVNNSGEIVGFYRRAGDSCEPGVATSVQVPNCRVHGFKIVNGTLTELMVPGSLSTAITGVNDYGDLVGYYTKIVSGCHVPMEHGFIWLHENVIKTIDYGRGVTNFCGTDSLWTVPFGINRAGTVIGAIWSSYEAMTSTGFAWKNGTFANMNPGGTPTGVFGIANRGAIVGATWRIFGSIPMWVGYMKAGGDEDFFTISQDNSWTTGVNNSFDIVGFGVYGNGFFAKHIELNEGTNDSREVDPVFLPLQFPGAVSTYPFGLNDQRAAVGAYIAMATGQVRGFVAAPTF
jgi:hypothetical protein